VAVLHTLGAPDKLSHLIESESLLNDGTAYVVFAIFKEFAAGVHLSGGEIVGQFFQLSLGGALFGLAMGLASEFVMRLPGVHGDPLTEISLLICVVYSTFFIAEHYLHVSGVLAVVAFGVFLGKEREIAVGRTAEKRNHDFWEMVSFISNSFIFVLSGLVIYNKLHDMDSHKRGINIGTLLAMYVVLHLVRGLMVYGARAVGLKRMGYGVNMNEAHVMVYSGLRGAVGLALAMEVEHDHRIDVAVQDTIVIQVGGIVALTLLINGTTAGLFYEYLNPYPEDPYRESLTVRTLIQLDIEVHGSSSRHFIGEDNKKKKGNQRRRSSVSGKIKENSASSKAPSTPYPTADFPFASSGKLPVEEAVKEASRGLLHHLAGSPFHSFAGDLKDWCLLHWRRTNLTPPTPHFLVIAANYRLVHCA
jgi:NhaP-type Na+/H+ or K+/H+ antiporter